MNKDNVLSLLRALATAFGTFLVGKVLAGHTIDTELWQLIVGAVLAVVSTVWGFLDKSIPVEGLESVVRQVGLAIGGVLVALGKLSSENLNTYLGIITLLVPVILSFLNRKKSAQLVAGKFDVTDLRGAKKVA